MAVTVTFFLLLSAVQYSGLYRHIKSARVACAERSRSEPDYAVVQSWMLLFCCQKKV